MISRRLSMLLAITVLMGPLGAHVANAQAPSAIAGAITVDADRLIGLVESKPGIVIVDSRTTKDYAAGHIEGSHQILDEAMTPESLSALAPTKATPVLFYCNGKKCGRAAVAAEKAVGWGYSEVYYYYEGMPEWLAKGLPVVR